MCVCLQLSEHLQRPGFCVKDSSSGVVTSAGGLELKYLQPSQTLYSWPTDGGQGDPYAVMNIFERRQQELRARAGDAIASAAAGACIVQAMNAEMYMCHCYTLWPAHNCLSRTELHVACDDYWTLLVSCPRR